MFEFFAVKKYYNIVREKIKLIDLYKILLNYFGPQEWWPAETPFEVVVGAILTQQTNWKNVEKAIDNLRKNNLLDLVKRNYQEIAEDFDTTRKKYLWPELVKLASMVKAGDRILDVGCGNGRLIEAFRDKKRSA